jgi:integrase/recombinase XerD
MILEVIPTESRSIDQYEELSSDEKLIGMWLHGRSQNTQKIYRRAVRRFIQCSIRETTLPMIQAFVDSMQDLAPASQTVTINALRSLYKFALEIGYLQVNVMRAVKPPKYPKRIAERILEKEEVHAMIDGETNHRNRVVLMLLYYGALRLSELSGLEWRHIQQGQSGGVVTVFGKGGKTRSVLIPQHIYDEIMSLRPVNVSLEDPIFSTDRLVGRTTTWNMKPRRIEYMVRAAADRVGIGKPVSPHWLRHSHATHALESGAPIHLVSRTLGHSSISVTESYLHVRPNESSATYL